MNAEKIFGEDVYVNLDEVIETVYQCRRAVASAGQEMYAKGYEDGRKSIEVSEDCIDRKKFIEVLDATANIWVEQGNDIMANGILTARIIANDAPSVVPKDKCKVCQQYDIGYEDGSLDMLQTLSKAIDTSKQE